MSVKTVSLARMLFLAALFQSFAALAQEGERWSKAELDRANTAVDVNYMTVEEKKALQLVNLARMDGKRFFEAFIPAYLELHNLSYRKIYEDNPYVLSLRQELENIKDLPLLYPDESLYKAAAHHAEDLGSKGKTGHDSTNGTSFSERLRRFAGRRRSVSENISYGFAEALGIVGQLLVDEGVASLGHRRNILRAGDSFIGVAIRPHAKWGTVCVTDFSGELLTRR